MDAEVSTHSWQWLLRNLSVSCRVNQICFCNYSYVVHTEYIFISIFIFHSGIRAKSSNYYYWGTIQGNCVPAHRDEKRLAVERNFWEHVLPMKDSGSMCSHSLSNRKKMNGRRYNYMLDTWEWPQCYFDYNLLPSRISFTFILAVM
jgi:hypothetical protein